MSRRALFILGCGLLLGGGLLVIYLLQQLHPYDKLVNHGPSPEARANPYLAAELFLRQQKLEVQRADGLDELKDLEKESLISEDSLRVYSERVQKITDDSIAEADRMLAAKEQEIMQV